MTKQTEYEKFVASIPYGKHTVEYFSSRETARKKFGFSIPDFNTLKFIKSLKQPILDVGAGNGYWVWELKKLGVDARATSLQKEWYPLQMNWGDVENLTAIDAIAKYPNTVLMYNWPCYAEPWAHESLLTYQGNQVIYIGEGFGGCTANDGFHQELEDNWIEKKKIYIPQWWGLHDTFMYYERKKFFF